VTCGFSGTTGGVLLRVELGTRGIGTGGGGISISEGRERWQSLRLSSVDCEHSGDP
jgi:hypothetical protein